MHGTVEAALDAGGFDAVSQLGGESGVDVIVVPGSKSVGSSSRCSRNDTWKESKIRFDSRSHKQYAFEWGEYPMRMHGRERVYVFGTAVGISAKVRQPISHRWDREGFCSNHSSNGVRPCNEEDGVRFVRYAEVAQNSSHSVVGAEQEIIIARALSRIVR